MYPEDNIKVNMDSWWICYKCTAASEGKEPAGGQEVNLGILEEI